MSKQKSAEETYVEERLKAIPAVASQEVLIGFFTAAAESSPANFLQVAEMIDGMEEAWYGKDHDKEN